MPDVTPKEFNGWAVFDAEGMIHPATVSEKQSGAWNRIAGGKSYWESRGYRCLPVTVRVTPLAGGKGEG